MRTGKQIAAGLLALLLTLFCAVGDAPAGQERHTDAESGYAWIIGDDAGYFSDADRKSLGELMAQITPHCNVILLTTTSHPYSRTFDYAEHYFDSCFGASADGIVFVIDRNLNEIFLYTNGSIRSAITDSRAYSITDNTYLYATASHNYDYYTCSYKTLEQALSLLEGRRIAQPMKYICSALLAVIVALLANYFVAMLLSRSRKASIREILTGVYSNVRVHQPNAVFTGQTKRYSPQSSGGSGGSHGGGGGGHSSGGGSHGGGGGHRI